MTRELVDYGLALLVLMGLELAASFALRRSVLRQAERDRFAAWFRFIFTMLGLRLATLSAWGIAASVSGAWGRLQSVSQISQTWLYLAVFALGHFALFATSTLLTVSVLRPVDATIRGRKSPRVDFATLLAVLMLGCLVLPGILVAVAIAAYPLTGLFPPWSPQGNLRLAVLLVIAALAVAVGTLVRFVDLGDLTPRELTVGELHDAIRDLADRASVRLDKIFLVPGLRTWFANAGAGSRSRILLTEYLVRELDRREVVAVVAHEIAPPEAPGPFQAPAVPASEDGRLGRGSRRDHLWWRCGVGGVPGSRSGLRPHALAFLDGRPGRRSRCHLQRLLRLSPG